MKNLKKPNYNQKQRIARAGIDPMRVFVKSEDDECIVVLDRDSEKTLRITGKHFEEVK